MLTSMSNNAKKPEAKAPAKRFDLCIAERILARDRIAAATRKIYDEVASYALDRIGLPKQPVTIVRNNGEFVAIEFEAQLLPAPPPPDPKATPAAETAPAPPPVVEAPAPPAGDAPAAVTPPT